MSKFIQIPILKNIDEMDSVACLPINQYNWGGDYRPEVYGRVAYIKSHGFLVQFQCYESTVSCQYTEDADPVYLDSAVEFFLQIPFLSNANPSEPYFNVPYFNIEMNSNGAILAGFGPGKENRHPLDLMEIKQIKRQVSWNAAHDCWEASILLPVSIISHYIPINGQDLIPDTRIRFQLYKIAEGDLLTHFASLGPIESPVPNFHLSSYFVDGILTLP